MELVPFCSYSASVSDRADFSGVTPVGRRTVVGVTEGRWEGERFSASQRGGTAADWLVMSAEGVAMPDVRMSLRTDDGAFVYVTYQGRADWSGGVGSGWVYVVPRFQTADERYRWLNTTLFVGKGRLVEGRQARYEIFEVR